jgi:hypothetical protein
VVVEGQFGCGEALGADSGAGQEACGAGLAAGAAHDAPVRDRPAALEEQDVGELDVPVDPVVAVCVGQAGGNCAHEGVQLGGVLQCGPLVLDSGLGERHDDPSWP